MSHRTENTHKTSWPLHPPPGVLDDRSKLGAYQNRLEHTVTSLDASEEDLTSAVSRIKDIDMAAESTEYTQHSILVQAATSVLAQANDLPQQALQLIQ